MNTQEFNYKLSIQSEEELVQYIESLPLDRLVYIESIHAPTTRETPTLITEIESIRKLLEGDQKIVILSPLSQFKKLSIQQFRTVGWIIGNLLGTPLPQNEAQDRIVCVYDRDRTKTMAQGARYHQTREGGTIHTDNVNVPFHWDYMVLSSIQPAVAGGESILVKGETVHAILKKDYPDALKILEQNFTWEKRGISNDTYQAPIITYTKTNMPLFRHLRPYMESAHMRTNNPLSEDQRYALDVLDSLLENSHHQYRHTFSPGEILLTNDSQIFHGRTCFSDAPNALSITEWTPQSNNPLKRTLDRMWIKR